MHIDIDVDDELIERACRVTGIRDKREVIHEALRALYPGASSAGLPVSA